MGAVIAGCLALRQPGVALGDAFTVPFHPYLWRGGMFSVALSVCTPCDVQPPLTERGLLPDARTFLWESPSAGAPTPSDYLIIALQNPIPKYGILPGDLPVHPHPTTQDKSAAVTLHTQSL